MRLFVAIFAVLCVLSTNLWAQNSNALTKEQILQMSVDELSALPLEDLMAAVETLGVSSVDELFAAIMNKNVSSASKNEESSFSSPLATTVITKEELRTYGATTIEDAFRLIPGMIVTQKTNGIFDIHIRGLNNIPDNNMFQYSENMNALVMVDGRVVNNYITSITPFYSLPVSIEDIERIEVVRGANTALYGMGAFTGVINIITEKPTSASKEVSGSLQIGNMNTVVADFALRHTFNNKFSAGIVANIQHRDRPTDKLFVTPTNDLYKVNDPTILSPTNPNRGYDINGTIDELVASGKVTPIFEGGEMSIEDLKNTYQYLDNSIDQRFFPMTEVETPLESMFRGTQLARKNVGINGYLRFTPTANIDINLTGGYNEAYQYNTTLQQDYTSANGQEQNAGYVNLDVKAYGLHLQTNYSGGPIDFSMGTAGYKSDADNFSAQAEYQAKVGPLSIIPSFGYLYVKQTDRIRQFDYGQGPVDLSGFFGGSSTLEIVSPSLRLDYKLGNKLRLVGAIRGDKPNKPDKWHVSYQGEASYLFNDRNFLRLVYSRAYSTPNMVNTSTDYRMVRTGMIDPVVMNVKGNKEADLRHIDNFEIGYRWRPTDNLLLDAEAFYSMSEDYGSLSTLESYYTLDGKLMESLFGSIVYDLQSYGANLTPEISQQVVQQGIKRTMQNLSSNSTLQYNTVPYKVHQMGLSLNVDYIVSSKLILKLNANVQKTEIDDYFKYCQTLELANQMGNALMQTGSCFYELVPSILDPNTGLLYMANATGKAYIDNFIANSGWNNWSAEDQAAFTQELYNSYLRALQDGRINAENPFLARDDINFNGNTYTIDAPLSAYYALKYNTRLNNGVFQIGNSREQSREMEDNHEHKAAPNVYGMIGAVYKPSPLFTIAAYGNYVGKHYINSLYSSIIDYYAERNPIYQGMAQTEVKAKFTLNAKVGYTPSSNVEFFINAQNLFNNDSREYVYMDKIGGLYTVGVNFKF